MPRCLLDLHPVAGRVARGAARLDGAGEMDGAAVEEELLGERGLAGVRVRDDRECAPALGFASEGGVGRFRGKGAGVGKICAGHLHGIYQIPRRD